MSKCGYVSLLLLFGAAVCNSLDLYPNVTLENIGTPSVTAPYNLFIYTWPVEEQAKRPGTVTAIEYCFQRRTYAPFQPIFTLRLLKSFGYGYTIYQTIDVTTRNFSSCSYRGRVDTCCERKPLRQRDRFQIPSEIDAFGISATGDNAILGYTRRQQNSTMGFQIPVNAIYNGHISLTTADMFTISYRMFNFVIETLSSSTTTLSTNSSSTSDGRGTTQPQLPPSVTDSISITSNSASTLTRAATDSEIDPSLATTSTSLVTSSVGSTSSSTTQELPTNETIAQFPVGAPNSSSISVVASVVAGTIIAVVLHIVLLVVVIYMCYRAREMRKSANVQSVMKNTLREMDQSIYDSIYAVPTSQSCTNINEPESMGESDQYSYESSNYTLPQDSTGALPVVVNRNPAYGYHDKLDSLEEPYISLNSVNKGLNEMNPYTKILPPTP